MTRAGKHTSPDLELQVRRFVHRLAAAAFGAVEVDVPLPAAAPYGLPPTRPGLSNPLAGVRAAVLVRRVADQVLGAEAVEARAGGRTWEAVADALGLGADTTVMPGPRAVRAFETVAGLSDPWWTAQVRWACTSCRCRVADTGPWQGHPDITEAGYAAGCARCSATGPPPDRPPSPVLPPEAPPTPSPTRPTDRPSPERPGGR